MTQFAFNDWRDRFGALIEEVRHDDCLDAPIVND